MNLHSLSLRLAAILAGVLLLVLGGVGVWVDRELARAIHSADTEQVKVHAQTLMASLKTLMLNGSGTLAREWLDRLHGVAGILEIEVLRRDGSEAFTDLRTVEKVNGYLGGPVFEREPRPARHPELAAPDMLERALRGETVLDDSRPGVLALMAPIRADVACFSCHGYDRAPLRGVFYLAVSTTETQARIQATRTKLWVGALALALALGLILFLALRRDVIRPLGILRAAIDEVARGGRQVRIPVERNDEIGELAVAFNQMQEALRVSEARTRAVMDHVADAIILIDPQGVVRLANASCERVFGYPPGQLVGQPVERLVPEPYRESAKRLFLGGEDEEETHELYGRRRNGTVFPMEVTLRRTRLGATEYTIAVARDITSRKVQTAALRYQALHDALTDLPNRTLLFDRMQQCVRAAQREKGRFALCLMDLDRFKIVNDTLGHQVGDKLLQQVAQRLRLLLRESDTVARLGGDEFAILLPGADVRQAVHTANKLVKALEEPFVVDGQRLQVGCSMGIALYPYHGRDAGVLLQRADVAMYMAKRENRGYALYDPESDQHNLRQLAVMGELREALSQGQLLLHYQPVWSFHKARVTACEALVRWHHPVHGIMQPSEFIPLAEQTGLIHTLTDWVLERVLAECAPLILSHGLCLAVNLSARDLQRPSLAEDVARQVEAAGVSPRFVKLEVTETALVEDIRAASRILEALNQRGFTVSIDDFGTGYSSLSYLKQMPVNEIKIDRSFIVGLVQDEHSRVIVRSTIDMAHDLGLRVIAEGVEDARAAELLKSMGVDAIQGYFISPPLPGEAFQKQLQAGFSPPGLA